LRARHGEALLAEGRLETSRPDLLLPLRSRLGTWELASWDRRETRVHYDMATLTASGVLSVFVALLALLVFGQQRRATARAAQRVSFVNRVSHELRTPLTNILLNLDLATEALAEAPGDATRRLDLVQEEARRLGRLIDNVLTFSRHEQGKLRAEPRACVPAGVVAAVVDQFAPSFARRALEVHWRGDLSTPCLLDADALAQILANLFSNVEKYVPGGAVELTGVYDQGTLVVTLADQGPGIPPEASERIFLPFERLDSRVNEGASGTGLGLAIARDLATAMGGSLRLRPATRGACFELRVPAPPAPPLSSVSAA
jgi:signal transduction histidine kinase